jgi:hypothetical protein
VEMMMYIAYMAYEFLALCKIFNVHILHTRELKKGGYNKDNKNAPECSYIKSMNVKLSILYLPNSTELRPS